MRIRWATRLVALAATLILLTSPGTGGTEPEEPGPGVPTAPVVTLDALPLGVPAAELSPEARARAETVLGRSLFAQRVQGIRFRSREKVFGFLLEHPDFAASVARALRLGRYRVEPVEDGYWGDDARGATGRIRVLHADPGRRLFHLEGRYQTRGWPALDGQLLVLLEFRHQPDEGGGTVVEASLTGHLRIDTPLVGMMAQAVSLFTRPMVERAVERKVRRFFGTVARVSRSAHDQPEQLLRTLDGHPEVPAGPILAAFRTILLEDHPPAWVDEPFRLLGDGAPPATSP